MRLAMQRTLWALCIFSELASLVANARDSVLTLIPPDAVAFAVVHNLADTSHSLADVAKLVQAPAPDLLSLAKGMTGLQKGLDEQGDLAVVLTNIDAAPKVVLLIPVANFDDFFASLNAKPPANGVCEVQVAGSAAVVGRKGNFAAITRTADRDGLEQFIASTISLAADAPLATWLDANTASIAVTSHGIKQLIPKFIASIRALQMQIAQNPAESVQRAAEGLNIYIDFFTAAEPEVEQFAVGLRINAASSVNLVSRVQFVTDGACAKWASATQPATGDLLAGLPAGPFVAAAGSIIPPGALQQLMKFSVQAMQSNPMFKLTSEQAQRYSEISSNVMNGAQSMRMLMGVAAPGAGLFGNTSTVMFFDDSKGFIDRYEKTLGDLREFAKEVKSPAIPSPASQRIKLGDIDVLQVSMELPDMQQETGLGAPDPKKIRQLMFGADGNMTLYLAAADEHAVVTAYTSPDNLKAAIDFYSSRRPGLSSDTNVAKVAAALPVGAQAVAYVGLSGAANVVKQFVAAAIPIARPGAIPDFPDSPPIGMAAKVSPSGVEGHFVVTADTLRSIGEVVAKTRGAAPPADSPPDAHP